MTLHVDNPKDGKEVKEWFIGQMTRFAAFCLPYYKELSDKFQTSWPKRKSIRTEKNLGLSATKMWIKGKRLEYDDDGGMVIFDIGDGDGDVDGDGDEGDDEEEKDTMNNNEGNRREGDVDEEEAIKRRRKKYEKKKAAKLRKQVEKDTNINKHVLFIDAKSENRNLVDKQGSTAQELDNKDRGIQIMRC